MDFSSICELSIQDYRGDPEVLASRLPNRLLGFWSLTVGGPGLHHLVLAIPNNSLEHLSLLYPGLSHNFTAVLGAQGESLKSLQWHNFEVLSTVRPVLPESELQRLHVTAPNLKSSTLDLNRRDDDDWP